MHPMCTAPCRSLFDVDGLGLGQCPPVTSCAVAAHIGDMAEFRYTGARTKKQDILTFTMGALLIGGFSALAMNGYFYTDHRLEQSRSTVYEAALLSDEEMTELSISDLTRYHDAVTDYAKHDGNPTISTVTLDRLAEAIHTRDGK